MRRLIILAEVALGLLFASCTKEEQRTLSVIPAPLKVELQQGVFPLNPETGLYIDASEGDKKILKDYLAASFMKLKPRSASSSWGEETPRSSRKPSTLPSRPRSLR